MLVQIAESRALPSAESVIRQRYRDGEVDADHADVDAIGEVARGVAVPSENGDPIAIIVLGGKPQRFVVILGAHHREHRPEDFLFVDTHFGPHFVE